jgi:hypothetical protein
MPQILDPRTNPLLMVGLLFAASFALACGGGGGSSTAAATATPGTVAVLLTDAPADPSLFSAIDAVIERVELIGGDAGRRVIYEGEPKTIDLLSLRTHSVPLGLDLEVPPARFCKIRLVLSSLELVLADTGERVPTRLPGNGKIDLVLGDCVTVEEGETALVQLDVDAARSIHVTEAPRGSRRFQFRPVIHADVIKADFREKVVRLEGELAEFDEAASEILLCDVLRVAATDDRPEYRGCVKARVLEETAVFDNVDQDGLPIAIADLFDERWIGERVTVVGLLDRLYPAMPPIRVPRGHLPPPGSCKLWYRDTPPGQQPPPIGCDLAPDDVPDGAVLIDSSGRPVVDLRGLIAIDSFVVQLGEALRLAATVAGVPTDDVIPVLPDVDQSLPSDAPIDVVLEPAPPGGNGSRVLSTTGEPLLPSDLFDGDAVLVDGVLVPDDPDFVRAALVLVDLDRLLERISTGEVVDPTPAGFTLLADVNGCRTGPELDVWTDEATRILRVTITDEGSTSEIAEAVTAGDEVSVTGACQPEGLVADVVLILVDERPPVEEPAPAS